MYFQLLFRHTLCRLIRKNVYENQNMHLALACSESGNQQQFLDKHYIIHIRDSYYSIPLCLREHI